MTDFEAALDSWITNPGTHVQYIDVYCTNLDCLALNKPVNVVVTTEYGISRWEPDGCPDCGLPLEEEPLEV